MELTRKTKLRTSNSDNILRYENNYTLNIEKSLRKKLESTKRPEIVYTKTGGGVTAKLDAVTFELFNHACEVYYKNTSEILDFKKTVATDKEGNNVQVTYNITDATNSSFTINAYLTNCTLLINGKNTNRFESKDVKEIHKIMSNTKISGVKANIAKWNEKLAIDLEEAIATLQTNMNTIQLGNNYNSTSENKNHDEKCGKCNRNCRTKAVECRNGHWVHYNCEKLNDEDIQKVKKKDAIYTCTTCTSISDKKKTTLAIAKRSEEYSKAHKLTLAEDLLVEEFEQRCQACNNSIQNGGDTCNVCLMQFHESCLNVDNNTCFGCIGNLDQNDIQQTKVLSIDTDQTVEPIRMEKSQQRKENADIIATSNTQTNIVITTEQIQPEPIPNIEDHKIKLKELRQLEQRLRKKEEQLKLKEVAINDTMTEKTRILDRMYKAEARNLEMEHTVKNFQNRIEMLESRKTLQGDGGNFHSIPKKDENSCPTRENDDLILGIREKVTKFILGKVENELNKLQNHDYEETPKTNLNEQRQEYYNQHQTCIPTYNQWPSSYCQDWTNEYNQYNSHQSKQEIDHNQRYINDDTNICRDNLIELTPSGEHDDSLKYINIPDDSSNHYTLNTNRTSAEKKTDGTQQGPKNMDENWFYMSREGQPLYYSTSDRNEYFLYQNSLSRSRLKYTNN